MSRTVVIGAGLSGLTHAYALASRGQEVLVLEASDRPGGVVRSQRQDGFLLEMGPNTVRITAEIWGLVESLGLTGEALIASARMPRYIDFGGRLHPVPMSPVALLATELLSVRGKRRLLREPFVSRAAAEEETVHAFFERRLGREVAERLVEPFVAGVFAGSSRDLEVAAAFPALARWEREDGSLLRGALAERRKKGPPAWVPRGLLSFREGLETLSKALAAALGERLRTGTRVEELRPEPQGWSLSTAGERWTVGRIVLAVPAAEAARLLEPFAAEAATALQAIPHPFLAVLHLAWPASALTRPLDGFGHLVVPQPGRRILGAVWSSSLFGGRAPSGQALFTVFLGGARDPEATELSDEGLICAAVRDLQAELGMSAVPEVLSITRYPRSIPQYVTGHTQRMKLLSDAEARFPNLHFLGNYRGGISVGDITRNALAPEKQPNL